MRFSSLVIEHSLTSRLLRRMVVPMAGAALLLGVGGSLVITSAVETVNDRILGAASRAIADSLTVEDGAVSLNLSPALFGMLEDSERDNVFYSVRQGGTVLTGYSDLPDIAPRGLHDTQVRFGNGTYKGVAVRVVAEGRRLPQISEPVTVEVAETMGARQRTSSRMLLALALLEALLIGLTAVLLPLAVRWGMKPVVGLGAEMDARAGSDLKPLSTSGVPSELSDLVRAFNRLLERLDATLQNMRQFTADASHQMRTPLSILRTHVTLLRRSPASDEQARQSLEDIDQATERLQRLLTQLLALARADSSAQEELAREHVDMNMLAGSAATDHAPQAVRLEVDLRFEPANGEPIAATHSMLAVELLGNLIDNAVSYNLPGGSVTVSVGRRGKKILVSIEDDGPGIPPEDRERVFTRFARLTRDTSRPGSGLGLPIANMLARAIGATLKLETARSGQGLRVEVTFPADPV